MGFGCPAVAKAGTSQKGSTGGNTSFCPDLVISESFGSPNIPTIWAARGVFD